MDGFSTHPLILAALMLGISMLPFLALGLTSFVKISVIFGLLRLALGTQQIPSSIITSLLAALLTMFIMTPVFAEMKTRAIPVLDGFSEKESLGNAAKLVSFLETLLSETSGPLLSFLARHSRTKERWFFLQVARSGPTHRGDVMPPWTSDKGEGLGLLPGEGFRSLAPAFLLSELRSAFYFGFLLFLPFIVIDLVVATLLVAMGMTMVSPMSIALPIKIFLFVATDAWFLLIRSLLLSYA